MERYRSHEALLRGQLFRPPLFSYSGKYNEFYVGDTMMFHNLTVQAGIRYDDQKSAVQPLDVQPNPILSTPLTLPCITTLTCTGGSLSAQLPGVVYPGQDEELTWKGISPRLGLTYAVGAEKKTLLRAAYNRYMSQLGSAVSSSSPVGNSQFTFLGHDSNGDHTIQRGELVRVRNFSGINPAAPSSIVSTRRVDYDMNPPHTDEFLIGAEHELWSDFAVGVTFTHRVNNDLPVVRYEKTQGAGDWYTSADYEPAFVAGGTYTGQFYTVTVPNVQVYQLKAGLANPNFSVITNRPNYKQTYNGFEVTATKRMSHQWMLRVNASYNDYKEDCGDGSFANPTPALPSTGLINGAATQAGPANLPRRSARSAVGRLRRVRQRLPQLEVEHQHQLRLHRSVGHQHRREPADAPGLSECVSRHLHPDGTARRHAGDRVPGPG